MNKQALNAVFLFIAELSGYRSGNVRTKIMYGQQQYSTGALPELCEEHLHERIWLERLYIELDKFYAWSMGDKLTKFHWSVPIELDASASMIGYMGCLLGDKRMLEAVNAAGDAGTLNDPWYIDGLSRNHVKKACTPKLYGSSKTVQELWLDNDLPHSLNDLTLMNKELQQGMFGTADLFKEFIINNCKPKATMYVKIWNDSFEIHCNRFKRVGEQTVAYDLYSSDERIRRIIHTKTKEVPDLEQFRRYFVTLLIHCLDSQVANTVAGKVYAKYGFCIDIHDAFIVSPIAAADTRRWYAEEMSKIFAQRHTILTNFFRSIGVGASASKDWQELHTKVVPIGKDFKCRGDVLK